MNESGLVAVLVMLLGGGFLGSTVTLLRYRKTGSAERDSFIAQGSEAAVSSLKVALDQETKRADRAEAALLDRDKRIEHMQRQLDAAQTALDELRHEMTALLKEMRG